jgi:5-methylcytosine-specific restriction endonuclease McrA
MAEYNLRKKTPEYREMMKLAMVNSQSHKDAVHSSEFIEKQRTNAIQSGRLPPIYSGEKHWSYGLPTELHPAFKGYGYCPDCGKRLSRRTKSKCMRCMNRKPGTLLYNQLRNVIEYRQWRNDVYTRDKFTCQSCGVVGGRLQAHHIKPFSEIYHENNVTNLKEGLDCRALWNINNGVTLCEDCHSKTDSFMNKQKSKMASGGF